MEVGYLQKYILVVLVFFGLAFLVKILVFPCTKKSMMKKRYVFAKKNVRGRDASARWAHGQRIREMARTRPHFPTQTNRIRAKRRSVWGRVLELALQVGPQLRKPTIGKPPHLARRAMAELLKRLG